jgi:tetratricopeptide (TPR) repeat protein
VWRLLVACGLAASALAADPPGTPASRAAMAARERADVLPEAVRAAALRDALADADRAIAADDADALAHWAAFCALGKLLEAEGVGWSAPGRLRRLRQEVDRTLVLAPDFADAMAGKGALLLGLPRLLGGDAEEGERLLRRALAVDPDYLTPRLRLAKALRERGALDEARTEARRALEIATRKQSAEDVRAAQAELDALGEAHANP